MKCKLEYFNIAAGICLCIAGVIYLFQSDYVSALNWGIFGSMYLAMDDYTPRAPAERNSGYWLRVVFGVAGFVLSVILLVSLL